MKWMKERDLLIAQTMAFVQSVTGKTPEAEKTVARRLSLLSVETSRNHPSGHGPSRRSLSEHSAAAGGDAARRPGADRKPGAIIEAPTLEVSVETPREIPKPAPARPSRPAGGFPVRDQGAGRQFPRPSGAVQPRARGLLHGHHGQGPRRPEGRRSRRRGWKIAARAPDASGIRRSPTIYFAWGCFRILSGSCSSAPNSARSSPAPAADASETPAGLRSSESGRAPS